MAHDRAIYKTRGMSDCIGKPFTQLELWGCLMKHFKPVRIISVQAAESGHRETDLRRKLIINFMEHNKNKAEEITGAIKTGDLILAHRLAHTLKSNAGQLGKTLLQQASEAIENALANEIDNVTQRQLTALETELYAVIAELAPLYEEFTKTADKTLAEPLDKKDAWELLQKITPLLENSNAECLGFVDGLRRIPGSEGLIMQINNIDFHKAAIALDELKSMIKSELFAEIS
jgi:HPt (histidine-containing phosphotransfer) domain-containing protein